MSAEEQDAYLGLGSNLGDRLQHLSDAVAALRATPGLQVEAVSALYETDPVGPPQGAYLNAALKLRTRLAPRELLARLQAIEARAGRVRGAERNGPRTLDLDLLLYAEVQLNEPDLELPHPRMAERAFVLEPLCELAPELRHPVLGTPLSELARRVRDPQAVRRASYTLCR